MDPQKVLESLAQQQGLPLTSLAEIGVRFSQSGKVACCGGLMTRLVTESAADSTVLLRDGSGSCYCALHGDITNRYPDVLTTGALLLLTDVTVLVLSSKVPPLLIVCLQNLSGLLLPDEATTAVAAAGVEAEEPGAIPAAAAPASATAESPVYPLHTGGSETTEESFFMPSRANCTAAPLAVSRDGITGAGQALADGAASGGHSAQLQPSLSHHSIPPGSYQAASETPDAKRLRVEDTVAARVPPPGDDDDDDAECLELVDDM